MPSNLKILHVIQTLAPRYGGPAKLCPEICAHLAERGVEPTIFTTNRDYPSGILDVPIGEPVKHDGVTTRYFPVDFGPLRASRSMARALRREVPKFDIVHIHELYRFPQAAAAHYARKYRVPYVVQPHGSLNPYIYQKRERRVLKRLYEHLIEFRNLRNAAALFYTTEDERANAAFLNLKPESFIVPNGLTLGEYDDLPERGGFRRKHDLGDKKIVLFLGRIAKSKGLDLLFEAFGKAAAGRDDLLLVVAGPDNDGFMPTARRWAASADIADKIVWTGMLNGAEVLEVLGDADIFALSSYSENFGIAVAEAMACRLPVLITDKVNIWREVMAADAGIVTTCEAPDVTRGLRQLIDSPDYWKRWGENGRALVQDRFEWSKVSQQMMDDYAAVINQWHRRHDRTAAAAQGLHGA